MSRRATSGACFKKQKRSSSKGKYFLTQLDFRLNRVFSAPLASLLLKTSLTPNQVTCLSLLSGVVAGGLFFYGEYFHSLAAAGFYILAALFDNCDGEIARTKGLTSVLGGWLDIASDLVVDSSIFIGISFSMLGQGHDANILFFLALCLSGSAIHCVVVVIEKLHGFGPAVHGAPNSGRPASMALFKIFDALREGDSCWIVLIFALIGKSHTLLWLGGIYMQVLWITALALNLRARFARQ